MPALADQFASIWIVLVAVFATSGERLRPIALVAKEVDTGLLIEIGVPGLHGVRLAPYPTGPRSLLVTIDADEVIACHLALGWPVPERIIDLMVEHRNVTNGRRDLRVGGLAGALLWHGGSARMGLASGTAPEQMQQRLDAMAQLLGRMRASLDLGRALLRGRYLCAVARIEAVGVPVDFGVVSGLADDWRATCRRVVEIVDRDYGVYRGGQFDGGAFAVWLDRRGIEWPRLETGQLDLGDDAYREMARAYPEVRPLKEVRSTLVNFDPRALAIGRDGRNRTPLRPFASSTSRNQPSAKASVLGTAAWVRHLIVPVPGSGLAMIDWQQQEFGIAAALSGDSAMQRAYRSGDPYLALAVFAGAAPPDATTTSHARIREQFKACALGLQYGMGPARLARHLGLQAVEARELQRRHRSAFATFWSWSDSVETHALIHRELQTVFGWRIEVGDDANPRSLRNFPVQANGAEMLRLACCLATEAGIAVCAVNHDALLIEAPLDLLDDAIACTQRLMAEASSIVLDGFTLRTSVRRVRAPDRWTDPRGQAVWSGIRQVLRLDDAPAHQRHSTCSPVNPRKVLSYGSKEDSSDASD